MPDSKIPYVGVELITEQQMFPIAKADAPTQIEVDEKRNASDWTEPDMPQEGLMQLVDNSDILPQCINAYKMNIAGFGIGIKYIEEDQEETTETLAEWRRMEDIINLLTIEQDTKEIFEDIIAARETYGIAYVEVIRDLQGNVVQIELIKDVPSVRMSRPLDYQDLTYYYRGQEIRRKKRFRKYKQEIGGTTVYFKEFGDPRIMDLRTGDYTEGTERKYQANEILEFKIGTENYGKVRWIGQMLGVDGSRRAENLNNNYFVSGRHVPLMIIIKGGTLTETSKAKLQSYMNGIRGSRGQHAFLVMEAEALDNDFDAKQPEIEIKSLADVLQHDELFQDYIVNNRKRVQSAFNLPDLYVGYTQDFNRATAQTAQEVTEKQVFQPERTSFEWILNNRLLNGYQFKYCEAYLQAPDISNPDDLFKILTVAEKAGGLTPNKAKAIAYEALGDTSDDYEGEWGDVPLVVSAQLNAKEAAAANLEAMKEQRNALEQNMGQSVKPSDKSNQTPQQGNVAPKVEGNVIDQVGNQIKKAEENGESDELIAIMKEVRNLLKSMG